MKSDLPAFEAFALPDVPLVRAGDDLIQLIMDAIAKADTHFQTGDILVIASKIVSKVEDRLVNLEGVSPSEEAEVIAGQTGKDPRVVELVLQESNDVSRVARGVLVTEHRLGFVSANAGIDQSNIAESETHVLLLPKNPDDTAQKLRQTIAEKTGATIAVIISDTHGRPFRMGNIGVAIGVAGMRALTDLRGEHDLYGRELAITMQGYADMVACAAHLLSGEGAEGRPLVVIRGLAFPQGEGNATDLNRPREQDLYR